MFRSLITPTLKFQSRQFQTSLKTLEKTLFVRNLAWSVNDNDLNSLFSQHGAVISARVISDRETGRSRGFGFVEMDDEAALKAIEELNGFELGGRPIAVAESDPNAKRSSPGGNFGGNRGDRGGERW
ncbi:hypothetical protein HDU92_002126 [Lobulomyces angularis]|nr:hypothetical protein HDU92_002126 [Lobulomyces angularis]